MDDKTAEPNAKKTPAHQADTRYLLVVCGLLLVVIILLGYLWMRERRHANTLQSQVDAYKASFQRMALGGQLDQIIAAQTGAQPGGLQRSELATETVTFDGEPRTVMLVGAAAGRRIGLEPGDVILISQPPKPAPTTAPATGRGNE